MSDFLYDVNSGKYLIQSDAEDRGYKDGYQSQYNPEVPKSPEEVASANRTIREILEGEQ